MKIILSTEGIKGNNIEIGKTSIELECTVSEALEAVQKLDETRSPLIMDKDLVQKISSSKAYPTEPKIDKKEIFDSISKLSNIAELLKEVSKLDINIPIITEMLDDNKNSDIECNGDCLNCNPFNIRGLKNDKKEQSADDLFNDIIRKSFEESHTMEEFLERMFKDIKDKENFDIINDNLEFEPFKKLFNNMANCYYNPSIDYTYTNKAVSAFKEYTKLKKLKKKDNDENKSADDIFANMIKDAVFQASQIVTSNSGQLKDIKDIIMYQTLQKNMAGNYEVLSRLEFGPFCQTYKKLQDGFVDVSEAVEDARRAFLLYKTI